MNWIGTALDTGSLPSFVSGLQSTMEPWKSFKVQGKPAAVSVLFAAAGADAPAHLILTKRTSKVGSHKGQIGFAGGRRDPEDEHPEDTALRELEEELGIDRNDVSVHGVLPDIKSIDGSIVKPVIMTTAVPWTEYQKSEIEVDQIIAIPWLEFRQDEGLHFRFNLFGKQRSSHLFHKEGHRVWGLTARIIYSADFR